jgi:hypothetical protein
MAAKALGESLIQPGAFAVWTNALFWKIIRKTKRQAEAD